MSNSASGRMVQVADELLFKVGVLECHSWFLVWVCSIDAGLWVLAPKVRIVSVIEIIDST